MQMKPTSLISFATLFPNKIDKKDRDSLKTEHKIPRNWPFKNDLLSTITT